MGKQNRYIISHRSTHHAQKSGYSILCEHVDALIIPDKREMIPYSLRKRISRWVAPEQNRYDSESVRKELQLIQTMLRKRGGLAHFLNGERDIHFSPRFKGLTGWKFLATFHKPPSVLRADFKPTYYRKLDAAVAVGPNQVEFLQKMGIPEVKFIPHGVDTDFFSPSSAHVVPGQFLFVGQHLRDFELLGQLLPKLRKAIPDFKLVVVMRRDTRHMLPEDPSIDFRSNLSDEELRDLYRYSVALLLPLLDCTACNSILEAMACGCPVISTDLECTREYKLDRLFEHKDIDGFVNASEALNNSSQERERMSTTQLTKVERFGWEKIGEEMTEFYNLLER